MSAEAVHRCRLICDVCGAVQVELQEDVTSARIAAAMQGWKYAQFKHRLKKGGARQAGPRHWDSCPDCPLPAGPEEAGRLVGERESE